jgi:phosphotransferase system HPr (HPr) family protein
MNAKSLLGIMSLSVVTGSVVTISADGTDEVEAVNALEAMLQQDIA